LAIFEDNHVSVVISCSLLAHLQGETTEQVVFVNRKVSYLAKEFYLELFLFNHTFLGKLAMKYYVIPL